MQRLGTRSARLAVATGLGLVVAALVVGVSAVAQSSGPHPSAPSRDLLPDLVQEAPSQLLISVGSAHGHTTYSLGFSSAVRNIGAGPLLLSGSRPNAATLTMTVDQTIDRAGQAPLVAPIPGHMQYVVSPDHRHWHYLRFDRYMLRHAGSITAVVADKKTGFCLGDDYKISKPPAGSPPYSVFVGRCGLKQPGLLHVSEGISVGYGDSYSAFLEGQSLPLDGLANGRYVLVHEVNVDHSIKERSYANDAASALLDIHWSGGRPHIHVLATCPDTDRCDLPGQTLSG